MHCPEAGLTRLIVLEWAGPIRTTKAIHAADLQSAPLIHLGAWPGDPFDKGVSFQHKSAISTRLLRMSNSSGLICRIPRNQRELPVCAQSHQGLWPRMLHHSVRFPVLVNLSSILEESST